MRGTAVSNYRSFLTELRFQLIKTLFKGFDSFKVLMFIHFAHFHHKVRYTPDYPRNWVAQGPRMTDSSGGFRGCALSKIFGKRKKNLL